MHTTSAPLLLFWLLVAHALCDYPLQGDFLAQAKNHLRPMRGVPWYQAMTAHALLHAGAVVLILGQWQLGLLEFVAHFFIDVWKSETSTYHGKASADELTFNLDQAAHVVCKIAWVLLFHYGWLR